MKKRPRPLGHSTMVEVEVEHLGCYEEVVVGGVKETEVTNLSSKEVKVTYPGSKEVEVKDCGSNEVKVIEKGRLFLQPLHLQVIEKLKKERYK
ncbi:unnamed protein product [Prunus armeniaca]